MTDKPNTVHSSNRGWILAALMFTMMLAAMDSTIVSTAIPQIVEDLGDFSLFSWVFSIYLLAQTATIPVYGKLADLYGRKPILIIGTLVFLLGSALSAVSWDMVSLIVFRGLQGLGAGAVMATVNTLAGDLYSVRERAKIQGYLSSVWGMAAILGPTLGGAFAEYLTWRWIFLINLPIGAVSLFLISHFLHEKVKKRHHHIDYFGAALIMIAGTVVIFTLTQGGQSWPWLSLQGIGMMLLSAILIAAVLFVEKRSTEPIMPTWIWKNKILIGCNLAVVGLGAMMIGPDMYIPVYGQSVMGLGAIAAGLVLASMSLGWPLASSLSGLLYLKIGFRNTALIGTLIIMVSSLSFVLLPYDAPIGWLVAVQICLGGGFGFLSTPTLVGIQSVVHWEQRGVVTGSNMFARYLGQSIGAALLGGVFNSSIRSQFSNAPEKLSGQLPEVNDIIGVMQGEGTPATLEEFLRHSFYFASHHVFIVIAITGVLTFLILWILPRRFPIVEDKEHQA